jgi:hypothetical protein
MMDVKTLSGANELYHEGPHARQRRRGAPVSERARRVNGEYIAKARTLDHEHTQAGGRHALPRLGLGQSCARRAPKFHCLIAFFWAQIARKFRLSDNCENKNETRKFRAISPLTALRQPLRHTLVQMAAGAQIVATGGRQSP